MSRPISPMSPIGPIRVRVQRVALRRAHYHHGALGHAHTPIGRYAHTQLMPHSKNMHGRLITCY